MVSGDPAARDQAARQFELIEQAIDAKDLKIWTEERNVRASIVYLLSGGEPAKLREVQEAKLVGENFRGLLAAALRYTEGETAELMAFDPRQYSAMLGGHIALIQGGALIGKDNARAMTLLDLARLFMPASLVEEAAIRREIGLLDPVRDNEKLQLLAIRYVTKYRASPYAQNFWDEFRTVTLGDANASSSSPSLDVVLDKAPADQRLDIYLTLSRRALLAGALDWGGDRLAKAEGAASESGARKRVNAYRLAMKAMRGESNASTLRTLDMSGLKPEDIELIKIAAGVSARLDIVNDGREKSRNDAQTDEDYPMANAIRKALSQSDELLQRASRR
jgi:chemotaxis protein MotC